MADTGSPSAKPADLGLLLLALLWGSSYGFIRVGVTTIPPITLIAARAAIAAVLLLLVMRLRGIALPRDPTTWRDFLIQALLNSVLPYTLLAWAEQHVEAGLATILNSTSPLITALATWTITRHEPVSPLKLVGVAIGLAGICLILGIEALSGVGSELVGQGAIVVATICYAGAALYGRRYAGMSPLVPAAGSMLCGALVLVPASLVVDAPWRLTPSVASILSLLGLSLLSTAFAFVIYFRLVRTLGSLGVTSQAYLRVPIGVAIGMVFLGEHPSPTAWIGMVCVVLGVAAITARPTRSR